MSFIEQKDGWLPSGAHGEIVLPKGVAVEVAIAAALKQLILPSQIPTFTDVKYLIKSDVVIADENGPSVQKSQDQRVFFELD